MAELRATGRPAGLPPAWRTLLRSPKKRCLRHPTCQRKRIAGCLQNRAGPLGALRGLAGKPGTRWDAEARAPADRSPVLTWSGQRGGWGAVLSGIYSAECFRLTCYLEGGTVLGAGHLGWVWMPYLLWVLCRYPRRGIRLGGAPVHRVSFWQELSIAFREHFLG